MIIRIVKLRFRESEIPSFLDNFEHIKTDIRTFPGCLRLELYRDTTDIDTFFTYSYWESASDLENYRNSAFFKKVWTQTKAKFAGKPEAWSVNRLACLP